MLKLIWSSCLCLLMAINISAKDNSAIKVASYNLRYCNPNDGINCWENRRDNLNALIRFHGFDIMGTQEGMLNQLKDVSRMDEFAYTGKGRDDGKEAGEFAAIFYRKARFQLLQSGDFWLSETPGIHPIISGFVHGQNSKTGIPGKYFTFSMCILTTKALKPGNNRHI